jgi:hypothetical protein
MLSTISVFGIKDRPEEAYRTLAALCCQRTLEEKAYWFSTG